MVLLRTGDSDVSAALVREAQGGSDEAFERLYRHHAPRIFALALRMTRTRGEAEDVTQEVFLRAWRSLGTFRRGSTFATWIHSIARNVVFDGSRTRKIPLVGIDEHLRDLARDLPDTRLDLERAVADLPDRARMAVLLAAAGHTYEEIAAIMETAIGTVKAQVHRARQLLKEALA